MKNKRRRRVHARQPRAHQCRPVACLFVNRCSVLRVSRAAS